MSEQEEVECASEGLSKDDFDELYNYADTLEFDVEYLEGDLEDVGFEDKEVLEKVEKMNRYVEGLKDAIAWMENYYFGSEIAEKSIDKFNENLADAIATTAEIIALLGEIADKITEAYRKSNEVRLSVNWIIYHATYILKYLEWMYHYVNDP